MKSINVMTSAVGETNFPKGLEVEQVNESLIAQAVRVYRAAARQGNAHTKTRGEVMGSTRKIYKQKGTGRARHGSIKAPVFVGGGTVHGPRAHDFDLNMPVSMRRAATLHALNARKDILGTIAGIEAFDKGTKDVAKALDTLNDTAKNVLLVLAPGDRSLFRKAVRNLEYVLTVPAEELNAYDVMKYATVLVEDQAWDALEKRLRVKGKSK